MIKRPTHGPAPDETRMLFAFVNAVLPHALELLCDLHRLHEGDARRAIRDIVDRRMQVRAMWQRREAELAAKKYPGPGT